LSKIPGNCKDGKPSPETKSWFGIDTLGIESEEQAATAMLPKGRVSGAQMYDFARYCSISPPRTTLQASPNPRRVADM
jgi:hypothetical protein